MASRQNREAREEVPTYGAPMSTPAPKTDRERERREKLETKPTAEERKRLIEEHEARGRAETAEGKNDRRTEGPRAEPEFETVRQPGGGTPAEIIQERPQDVMDAIDRAEGVEPVRTEPAPKVEAQPRRPLREPPKQKRR